MKEMDNYVENISLSKSPVKEALIIASTTSVEYLYALLNRALEKRNFKAAQAIFMGINVDTIHNIRLEEIKFCENESRLIK